MTERAVPFYCPFCGDEDLRPHEDTADAKAPARHGSWHCRACTRVFGLRFLGTLRPEVYA